MKSLDNDQSMLVHVTRERKHGQASQRSRVLAYIPWSQVAGKFGGIDQIRELVSSLPTESVLIYISTMSIVLNNTPWDLDNLHAQQRALAQYLCTPEVVLQVDRCIEEGIGDVLVHEEQLLLAAKLALCYGQPGPAKEIPLEQLGELLLGINDLLQEKDAEAATLRELMIIRSLRRRGISRNEQARYLLPRYFDLLVTRALILVGQEKMLERSGLKSAQVNALLGRAQESEIPPNPMQTGLGLEGSPTTEMTVTIYVFPFTAQ